MKTVIIFGGSGFVGRHIIRRIAKNGHKIIIPYQRQAKDAKLRLLGTTGQVIPIRYKSLKESKIKDLIDNSDVVINLKTLWDEKRINFKKGILDFNIDLVEIIKKIKKKPQLIYFSGIGIDEKNDSKRSQAIYQSEKYMQKNLINSLIVRPGVIIGGGDQFLKALLPLFKLSFFIPLFGDGLSKFQPIFIDDISIATSKMIDNNLLGNHIFEFVGSEIFTYKELYKFIVKCLNKKRVYVSIPLSLVKTGVVILDKFSISPLNLEQLKLFEKDNIASNNFKNLSNLNIFPQDLRTIIKKIIEKNM